MEGRGVEVWRSGGERCGGVEEWTGEVWRCEGVEGRDVEVRRSGWERCGGVEEWRGEAWKCGGVEGRGVEVFPPQSNYTVSTPLIPLLHYSTL